MKNRMEITEHVNIFLLFPCLWSLSLSLSLVSCWFVLFCFVFQWVCVFSFYRIHNIYCMLWVNAMATCEKSIFIVFHAVISTIGFLSHANTNFCKYFELCAPIFGRWGKKVFRITCNNMKSTCTQKVYPTWPSQKFSSCQIQWNFHGCFLFDPTKME